MREGRLVVGSAQAVMGFARGWGLRVIALITGVGVLVVSDGHGLACPCAGCSSMICLISR